jgi:hypothetical protein
LAAEQRISTLGIAVVNEGTISNSVKEICKRLEPWFATTIANRQGGDGLLLCGLLQSVCRRWTTSRMPASTPAMQRSPSLHDLRAKHWESAPTPVSPMLSAPERRGQATR